MAEHQQAQADKVELLPCPFCGSHGEEVALCVEDRDAPKGCEGWFVRCYVCHVETVRDQSQEDAVATWNRRAPSPSNGDLPPCFACNGTGRDLSVNHAPDAAAPMVPSHSRTILFGRDVAPQPAPSGWSLVPAEPTQAMLDAADKFVDSDPRFVAAAYRAMLAASPHHTDSGGGEVKPDPVAWRINTLEGHEVEPHWVYSERLPLTWAQSKFTITPLYTHPASGEMTDPNPELLRQAAEKLASIAPDLAMEVRRAAGLGGKGEQR